MCVSVCVCERDRERQIERQRERERERERGNKSMNIYSWLIHSDFSAALERGQIKQMNGIHIVIFKN